MSETTIKDDVRLNSCANCRLPTLADIETLLMRHFYRGVGLRLTFDEVRELYLRMRERQSDSVEAE